MFSLFFFCLLFSLYMSWKCYLHGTGRFFASVDPLMLFNTLWFCLYCIYCNFFFLKKAFLRQTTDVWGSACERGRTCFIYRLPATSAFAELFVVHLCYWSTQLNTLWLAREKKNWLLVLFSALSIIPALTMPEHSHVVEESHFSCSYPGFQFCQ